PRPATELLVEEVLNYIKKNKSRFRWAGYLDSRPPTRGGAPLESSFGQGSLLPFSPVGESVKAHKLNHKLPPHPRGLPRGIRRNLKIKAKNLTICDVGAGSGAIIISLAKNIKKSLPKQNFKFIGADISRGALNVAQKNAKTYKIKINFIKSNLLKNLTDKKIDILTANLPYLKNKEIKDALKYEPKRALSGGQRGAEIFKKLFVQIPDLKFPPEIIFLEIGDKQAKTLTELAKNLLPQYQRKIKKDFGGLDRALILSG
ncbi:HemK family protein methyltransferase, partial [Candidatus Falkowbacteria bacterium]|nr:HemK family protein methyltransferase [Candidatus Falkowbacteria bacterium]